MTSNGDFFNPFPITKVKGSVYSHDRSLVFKDSNKYINPHYANFLGDIKDSETSTDNTPVENNVKLVQNLEEYIKHVSDAGLRNNLVWFRGQSNSSHHPLPNIYRPYKLSDIYKHHCDTQLYRLEQLQLEQYRAFAFPYLEYMPNNDREWLILMQHFGLKTRLLDFTVDPLIALSFALEINSDNLNDLHDAAVWLLNPHELNKKHGIYHIPNIAADSDYFKSIPASFRVGEEGISGRGPSYKPPIAVIGALNNKRIISQSGSFLLFPNIFGMNDYPDHFKEPCSIPLPLFEKIIIDKNYKIQIRQQLRGMGYNNNKLYPGMESVASDILFRLAND